MTTAKKLLRVLAGEALDTPPVWLMRQAGRYLPEYRATREKAGSFLDLCYTPELAEEVTLQPIRRFGFDAAILFADILLVPHALGHDVRFVAGEGPRLDPIDERGGPGSLKPVDEIDEVLAPVYETVRRLSRSLPEEVTLIGFAGAPWTVATYMIAGQGTPDQRPAREMIYRDRAGFEALMERVTDATVHYLARQIEAGAEVVKLFDSWAGSLPAPLFDRYVTQPARTIADRLRAIHPQARLIGFPRGAGPRHRAYAEAAGMDAIAVDQQMPLAWARENSNGLPLQGNLDPLLMVVGGEALRSAVRDTVAALRGYPQILNLGHGITPEADPANVELVLETARGTADG